MRNALLSIGSCLKKRTQLICFLTDVADNDSDSAVALANQQACVEVAHVLLAAGNVAAGPLQLQDNLLNILHRNRTVHYVAHSFFLVDLCFWLPSNIRKR